MKKLPVFQPQVMGVAQIENASLVRVAFEQLEAVIEAATPSGRYRALTMTHLELACMCAVKAISHEWPTLTQQEIEDVAGRLKPGQGQE